MTTTIISKPDRPNQSLFLSSRNYSDTYVYIILRRRILGGLDSVDDDDDDEDLRVRLHSNPLKKREEKKNAISRRKRESCGTVELHVYLRLRNRRALN